MWFTPECFWWRTRWLVLQTRSEECRGSGFSRSAGDSRLTSCHYLIGSVLSTGCLGLRWAERTCCMVSAVHSVQMASASCDVFFLTCSSCAAWMIGSRVAAALLWYKLFPLSHSSNWLVLYLNTHTKKSGMGFMGDPQSSGSQTDPSVVQANMVLAQSDVKADLHLSARSFSNLNLNINKKPAHYVAWSMLFFYHCFSWGIWCLVLSCRPRKISIVIISLLKRLFKIIILDRAQPKTQFKLPWYEYIRT